MANNQQRDIKRNLRRMKREFLEARKSGGGDKIEFVTEVVNKIDEATKGVEVVDALKEMVAGQAAAVWESKSSKLDEQLVIAGCEIDYEVRFPDDTAPSGYRTVLSKFLTIRQHGLYIEMIRSERDDLDSKIVEQTAANDEAKRLARGNLDALIARYADASAASQAVE